MPWLQAHLRSDRPSAPLLEALLESLGALSVTLTDAGDEPQLETAPGEERIWSETIVTGLFEASTDRNSLGEAIADALERLGIAAEVALDSLEDQPWERAWMENFHPMRFGRRLWILPRGQQLPDEAADPVVVVLDPGLAFGTGTHATTSLCLEWLDGLELRDASILDYGCGSGILAIAALKLGARSATGCDIDPQAISATLANAKRNGVDDRLAASLATDLPGCQFDVVVANILANVLIALADDISALLKPDADLVMSGILTTQADDVIAAYVDLCDLEPCQTSDDWVLLHGRRR